MIHENVPESLEEFWKKPYHIDIDEGRDWELEIYNNPKSRLFIGCRALRSIERPLENTPEEAYSFRWLINEVLSKEVKDKILLITIDEAMAYNGCHDFPFKSLKIKRNFEGFKIKLEERVCL